jgi:hypothetical protein
MMEAFAADPAAAAKRWDRMSNLGALRVLAVLNFYELVATEYNSRVLEREVANPNLAYTVMAAWEAAEDFMKHLRLRDPTYFAEWKYLYDHHRNAIIASVAKGDDGDAGISSAAGAGTSQAGPAPPTGEELQGPSILPLLAAIRITLIVVGTMISIGLSIVGAVLLAVVARRPRWVP